MYLKKKDICIEYRPWARLVPAFCVRNSMVSKTFRLSSWGSRGMNINEKAIQICSYNLGKCYEGKTHVRLEVMFRLRFES